MAASTPRSKTEKITGISKPESLNKLEKLLRQRFSVDVGAPTQQYMVFRARLGHKGTEITLNIFTSDKILFQASPKVAEPAFEFISKTAAELARESVSHTTTKKTPRTIRAEQLMEHAAGLVSGYEVDLMVMVLLCDIVNDLVVTERLSEFVKDRELLESDSIPVKLHVLADKLAGVKDASLDAVLRGEDIAKLRQTRNKVAHGGQPVMPAEAQWALDLAREVFMSL